MNKRFFGLSATVLTLSALVGFGAVAYAGEAIGGLTYYGPYGGYNYENWATIYTNYNPPGYAFAEIHASTRNGAQVPAGYIGVYSQLYKGSVLCNDTLWHYNPYEVVNYHWDTGQNNCGTGSYQADGKTAAYRPSYGTYSVHGAIRSPAQNQSN